MHANLENISNEKNNCKMRDAFVPHFLRVQEHL